MKQAEFDAREKLAQLRLKREEIELRKGELEAARKRDAETADRERARIALDYSLRQAELESRNALDLHAREVAKTFRGAPGEHGATGPAGADGATGPQGDRGEGGVTGASGRDGAPGVSGERGAQGDRGPKGDKGDKGEVGASGASVSWRGSYSQGAQYLKGEIVEHEGSSWVARSPTGARPTLGSDWDLVAQAGASGAPGRDGVDGSSPGGGGGGGGITVTAVGAAPNANAAIVAGSALTLQPADATNPGVLSILAQAIAGLKTFVAGIALQANLSFSALSGATISSAVAGAASDVALVLDTTVARAATDSKSLSFRDNGTEYASFRRDATYGEVYFTVPVPTSTVPTVKLGNVYLSTYSDRFSIGSTPAAVDGELKCSQITLAGTTILNGNGIANGVTYPLTLSQSGAYAGGSSNGISIFGDGAAGGVLGRGVMAGVSSTAPAADFPLFSVCYGLSGTTSYAAAVVAAPNLNFLFSVTGDGKVNQRGTDGNATAGAQTINKPCGKGKIANAATTCVITNSLVTAASIVHLTWQGDHGAARAWVVPAAGSFTVTLNVAASAATVFSFEVMAII